MRGGAHLCMLHGSSRVRGRRGEGVEGREEVELSGHSSVSTPLGLPHPLRALCCTRQHPPPLPSHPLPHPSHPSKAHQTLGKTSPTLQPEPHAHLPLTPSPPHLPLTLSPPILRLTPSPPILPLTLSPPLLPLTPSPPLLPTRTTRCLQQPQSSQTELDGGHGMVEGEGHLGQGEVGQRAELKGEGGGGEALGGMADHEQQSLSLLQ